MTDTSDLELVRQFNRELKDYAKGLGLETESEGEEAFLESAKIRGLTVAEVVEEVRPGMLAQIRALATGRYDAALQEGEVQPPMLTIVK